MIRTFLKDASAEITYDTDIEVIFLRYISRPTNVRFIPINKILLENFCLLPDCNKFLVDTREIGAVTKTNQDWIIENLFPEMVKKLEGRTFYHAQILSVDLFGQLATANIRKGYKNLKFVVEAFPEFEQGLKWLLKQKG